MYIPLWHSFPSLSDLFILPVSGRWLSGHVIWSKLASLLLAEALKVYKTTKFKLD